MELRTRLASAAVLIAAVLLAVLVGPFTFALMVGAFAIVALLEWNRLVNAGRIGREWIPACLTIIAVIGLLFDRTALTWSFVAVGIGALVTAAVAAGLRSWVLWHALGVIYIGVPALALSAMRLSPGNGGPIVGGIFVAVWTADSAALFVGRFFGGPLLAPHLSPKKHWSGLIGSVVLTTLAEAVYVAIMGGYPLHGALFGFFIGVVANVGDLFESWVKRVFQRKNSGNLIPGHGGMLDRIDSLLFAAPAAMAILAIAGSESLFGANL